MWFRCLCCSWIASKLLTLYLRDTDQISSQAKRGIDGLFAKLFKTQSGLTLMGEDLFNRQTVADAERLVLLN
jgi:hypothetical protein